ncbi:putative ABC transport system ATP-binding protein [Methanohalophilus levihalophilus]|uniref:ABC transporter ATP-binding protein n=1 Tax=Methanohalophilus levihalophilus TaxID=1431282 RepID=UPI001AE4E72C|nr:ABC transporter ATP-binding protein [Methanohalophilus levihalophilus]MBP2031198.1 putative ABC transport system ATP-binding protein [Methanohalophilus levihalophilus]
MGQELIQFESISVSYSGKKVLEDFNLSVFEGEKILLKGKSGCGKSTLFSYLMGYSKPDSGNVFFNGKPLSPLIVGNVRTNISYVPQNADVAEGNIRDFINNIFSFSSVSVSADEQSVSDILSEFSLDNSVLDKDFSDLSGGEKQRLLLAVSILLDRNVFLLDEPTSSLDSDMKEKVAEYFTKNPSSTLLIVSHDPQWEKIVDRVVEVGNKV